jgi:hypothetical protein
MAGAGTQTAGLSAGGITTVNVANTEEYDGTSWTAGGNLNTARKNLGGAGTQTLGLAFGGDSGSPSNTTATEEYNGSSWTNSTNMTTARNALGGCGTQSSALAFGGYTTTFVATTEEYSGATLVTKTITTSTT